MARMFSHFEGKLKVLDTWSKELMAQKDTERARALLSIARTKMDELSVFTGHLHGLFSMMMVAMRNVKLSLTLEFSPKWIVMMPMRRFRWRTITTLMKLTWFNSLAKVKSLRTCVPFSLLNTEVTVNLIQIVQI